MLNNIILIFVILIINLYLFISIMLSPIEMYFLIFNALVVNREYRKLLCTQCKSDNGLICVHLPNEIILRILNYLNNIKFTNIHTFFRIKHKTGYNTVLSKYAILQNKKNIDTIKTFNGNVIQIDGHIVISILIIQCLYILKHTLYLIFEIDIFRKGGYIIDIVIYYLILKLIGLMSVSLLITYKCSNCVLSRKEYKHIISFQKETMIWHKDIHAYIFIKKLIINTTNYIIAKYWQLQRVRIPILSAITSGLLGGVYFAILTYFQSNIYVINASIIISVFAWIYSQT